MTRLLRPGRPLGAKAHAVLQRVSASPVTLRVLSVELKLSYQDSAATVRNLVNAGHLCYGDPQPSNGGRAPRLLRLASLEPTPAPFGLHALFRSR